MRKRHTLPNVDSRHTRAKSLAAAALFVVFFAVGCGGARPSKYYGLTVPGNATAAAASPNAAPVTLLIGRITAPELYREDPIVYSAGETMGTYEYHRWVEPPTQMIQEILLRELRESGRFRNVVLLRSDIHGDFLLHGHLFDFREVNSGSRIARVTMEMELRNIKTGTTVWTHFYSHDEPANGKDVDSLVSALDKNTQGAVAEFRASLDEYFAQHPPAQSAP